MRREPEGALERPRSSARFYDTPRAARGKLRGVPTPSPCKQAQLEFLESAIKVNESPEKLLGGGWDLQKVTDASDMFSGASDLKRGPVMPSARAPRFGGRQGRKWYV